MRKHALKALTHTVSLNLTATAFSQHHSVFKLRLHAVLALPTKLSAEFFFRARVHMPLRRVCCRGDRLFEGMRGGARRHSSGDPTRACNTARLQCLHLRFKRRNLIQ